MKPKTPTTPLPKIHGRGVENTSKSPKPQIPSTIGEENEENLQQLFLRKNAVLLKKGEKEVDLSVSYAHDQAAEWRDRELAFPFALYVGIFDRLEGFISLPFSWVEQETFLENDFRRNSDFGLSDISAGINYLLVKEDKKWPDVIGLLSFTAPTGKKPDPLLPDRVALGSGHWRTTAGLSLVKTYDPAVLFGGISYTRSFANTYRDGLRITPGDSFSYRFGLGFAINYQLAMFSQFLSIYQKETKRDGTKVRGSAQEPMLLEMGLTYSLGKYKYLQPALVFGLNDEAVDVTLDLSYIQQF